MNWCHAEIVSLKPSQELLVRNMAKLSIDTIMLTTDIASLEKEVSKLMSEQKENHTDYMKSHNLTAVLINKLFKQITSDDI